MTTIYFATSNDHKVSELKEALIGTGVDVERVNVDIDELDAEDVEDVACHKVMRSYEEADEPDELVIVDDTGLYVDALNGFPGSHAGFFLDKCGVEGVLQLMEDIYDRQAEFRACIAAYDPEKDKVYTFNGRCQGHIISQPQGDGGFGYDPIFVPKDYNRTFAEDETYKAKVSHRVRAVEKFVEWVQSR